MKKVKAWLLEDWWLKIISLVLAFVIWFVVVQANNPTDSSSFTNIKVTLLNTEIFDENNQVYSVIGKTDTVNVIVRAPKSVLSDLKAGDIIAEADVTTMENGKVGISYSIDGNYSVESVKGDKEYVELELEAKERKYIQLETRYVGEAAEGYLVGGMKADQNMIEISGPKSAIEKVVSAAVTIDVTNAKNSLSANVEIALYDSEGNEVTESSITKQVDYVHVNVEILETKTVTIYGSKSGVPADGYIYTGDFTITPAVIKIAGSPSELSGVSRILITDSVDITGADADVSVTYDLNKYLPDGIIFADSAFDGSVVATAFIEEKGYKTVEINTDSIVINAPDNVTASIVKNTDRVMISLTGLQRDLDVVTPESVVTSIDLSAWMLKNGIDVLKEDTYQIAADIFVGGNVSCPMEVLFDVKIEFK